jgi:hypothetical protein
MQGLERAVVTAEMNKVSDTDRRRDLRDYYWMSITLPRSGPA